ncbi:hypothetical protein BUALT_Bualt09G0009200 [Buddleja alternifolia]|uniref:Uncharacterized protein n=1 Tax=Buddleja alternifolia TaxID=168488 RepID=A0AAV6X3F8_9LAMI|nr:hypothetical protein BUALT_Bualt09G0009200 [Buddleja alternifolia]
MNEENSIDEFEEDGEWILVTRRRRQRRCIDELHPLFLRKSYSPTARKPNPMKVLKTSHVNFKKPSKSNHRTPMTLDEFFPKNFFESKGALPLKASTSSHVGKNQAKSVVVEHIPQVNPKGKEIVVDVYVQPGNTSKIQPKVTRSNDYQVMAKSPKVYKILEKSGYDFSNPSSLGKLEPELTGEKIHEGDGKGKKPSDNRVSIFDWLSTPIARPSVFGRLGSSSRIPNVHDRLSASSIPQSPVFNLLGSDEDSDPEASDDEIQEAPPQLEDVGHAIVDELKELNIVSVPNKDAVVSSPTTKRESSLQSFLPFPC